MDLSGKWYLETVFPDLAVMLQVREVLHSGQTAYQKVDVLESEIFGRSLVLDGKTQSTERDEHVYHEALVHPAMLFHPCPRTVFIGGGGEGGTLREVLCHRSVERVVMLDLDKEVVDHAAGFCPVITKAASTIPESSYSTKTLGSIWRTVRIAST